MLKISARNQLDGTVSRVVTGAVNSDVWLDIGNGDMIYSNITNTAIAQLDIQLGATLTAIIKASALILAVDENVRISARNRLLATIVAITPGAVNSEISLQLASGQLLTAIITAESVAGLGLCCGERCVALIKASSVILAAS